MFNALKYTEELEKAGFTQEQAKASLNLVIEVMNEEFATKSDLLAVRSELKADIGAVKSELKTDIFDLRSELKTDISDLRSELKTDISNLRSELKELEWRLDAKFHSIDSRFQSMESKMDHLESHLTIKLGAMMVVTVGLAVTLMKVI